MLPFDLAVDIEDCRWDQLSCANQITCGVFAVLDVILVGLSVAFFECFGDTGIPGALAIAGVDDQRVRGCDKDITCRLFDSKCFFRLGMVVHVVRRCCFE